MFRAKYCLLFMLLSALMPATAEGDPADEGPTGTLEIQVIDSVGSIPGASVELRVKKADAATALANEAGKVTFRTLRCDKTYSIEVSSAGHASRIVTGIEACEEQPLHLVVCLEEEVVCSLSIKNCRPVIDLETHHVSTIYTPQFMQDLPGMRGDPSGKPPKNAKESGKRCELPVAVISSSSEP
jgi:hypothetical protein